MCEEVDLSSPLKEERKLIALLGMDRGPHCESTTTVTQGGKIAMKGKSFIIVFLYADYVCRYVSVRSRHDVHFCADVLYGQAALFHWCFLRTAVGLNSVWRACLSRADWHLIKHPRHAYARGARRLKMNSTTCNSRKPGLSAGESLDECLQATRRIVVATNISSSRSCLSCHHEHVITPDQMNLNTKSYSAAKLLTGVS